MDLFSRARSPLFFLLLAPLAFAPTIHAADDSAPSSYRPIHANDGQYVPSIFLRRRRPTSQSWKPSGQISKADLDKFVTAVRAQADAGDHTYCLFDTNDNCFLRNTKAKFDLESAGLDISQASATIMIVETGTPPEPPPPRWFYHTAAVFYTSQGAYVFDPDNKNPNQVYDGDILTPLEDWMKVHWNFKRPVTFMAPPGVVLPGDVPGHPRYMPDEDARIRFWDRFQGKTPDDPIFDSVRQDQITASRVDELKTWAPKLPASSAKKFTELKKERESMRTASIAPSARPTPPPSPTMTPVAPLQPSHAPIPGGAASAPTPAPPPARPTAPVPDLPPRVLPEAPPPLTAPSDGVPNSPTSSSL